MTSRLSARRLGRALLTVALAAAATVGGVDLGSGAAAVSPVSPVHHVVLQVNAGHAR